MLNRGLAFKNIKIDYLNSKSSVTIELAYFSRVFIEFK
jgi:hypothetical protein